MPLVLAATLVLTSSQPFLSRITHSVYEAAAAANTDSLVTGIGDSEFYRVYTASAASGWGWTHLASIAPDGYPEDTWLGQQCLTGDGRYVVVEVLPTKGQNYESAADRGAAAFAIDIRTGMARPLVRGVAFRYFSPGCGADSKVTLTRFPTGEESTTQILLYDASTGRQLAEATVNGEVTSAVPAGTAIVAVRGHQLINVRPGGGVNSLAKLPGQPYDLRPSATGGVDLLVSDGGPRAGLWRWSSRGGVVQIGSGRLEQLELYQGRAGHNLVVGADKKSQVPADMHFVNTAGPRPPAAISLDGGAVLRPREPEPTQDPKDVRRVASFSVIERYVV